MCLLLPMTGNTMQATAMLTPRVPRMIPWSRMGDEALAGRAAAGNDAAFTALYERYHGALLGYCRSILLNAEDAHDATQSALENALRALPRRESGRALRPWLYRIAHNEAINIVRRRQPVDADVDPATVLTVPGPEVHSEQRTRLAQLVDDLRMLPERQRGALVMRELSGLSYDEIGLSLGVSNEAARRAVFDARSALHDAADGRATECVGVRRTLSDGDRRHLRARGVRAHLRSCDDCATFERAMSARQADLLALGPGLGGAGALGLIGLGAGGAGGSVLVAAGGSGGGVASGGLTWAGLPATVKGLAVAAAVATTGTAAVEIPKAVTHDSPAPQRQAASTRAAVAPTATSARRDALREQAIAQAAAARRARAARSGTAHRSDVARVHLSDGAVSLALERGISHATPPATPAPSPSAPTATTAPVATRPAPAATTQPEPEPAPAAAKTPQQIAAEKVQRVRDEVLAAFTNAQTVATSGAQGAVQTASAMMQTTLDAVRPLLERILATAGVSLPSSSAATPTTTGSPALATVLAPAQSLLGGLSGLLQTLLGQ
jgi:RNA polymerase sigma factor (sigma-70 family)